MNPEPRYELRRIPYARRRVWATTQLRKRHEREWQILRYDTRAEIKAEHPDLVGRPLADRIETRARQILHDRYPSEWAELLDEADRVLDRYENRRWF